MNRDITRIIAQFTSEVRFFAVNKQTYAISRTLKARSQVEFYRACERGQLIHVTNFLLDSEHGYLSRFAIYGLCKAVNEYSDTIWIIKFLLTKCTPMYGITQAIFATGNLTLINLVISSNIDWGDALCGAAESGNIDIATQIIKYYDPTIDRALHFAFLSGNPHMVDLIASHMTDVNWNNYVESACKSGYLSMFQFVQDKGVTNFDAGLRGACMSNNQEMIRKLYNLASARCDIGPSYIFLYKNHSLEIINMIINRFGISMRNAIGGMCQDGRYDILQTLSPKLLAQVTEFEIGYAAAYPDILRLLLNYVKDPDWNKVFNHVMDCPLESARLLIERASDADWSILLNSVCSSGELLIAELILSFYSPPNWSDIIYSATASGNLRLLKLLIEKSPISPDYGYMLDIACKEGKIDMINYVMTHTTNQTEILRTLYIILDPEVRQILLDHGAKCIV